MKNNKQNIKSENKIMIGGEMIKATPHGLCYESRITCPKCKKECIPCSVQIDEKIIPGDICTSCRNVYLKNNIQEINFECKIEFDKGEK